MTANDLWFHEERSCDNCKNITLVLQVGVMPHTWESVMHFCEDCITAFFVEEKVDDDSTSFG